MLYALLHLRHLDKPLISAQYHEKLALMEEHPQALAREYTVYTSCTFQKLGMPFSLLLQIRMWHMGRFHRSNCR